MEYTFKKANFCFNENAKGQIYCLLNILDEEGVPEYGSSGDYRPTMSKAIISAAENFLKGWGPDGHDDLVEALKEAYANKLLSKFEPIAWYDSVAFVYEGEVMFVEPDMQEPFFEIRTFNFEKKTVFTLEVNDFQNFNKMVEAAVEEGKDSAAAYDEWEASWIDGPQLNW